MTETIEEMTYTMLSLLFLLLGIVLIVSIVMSKANPYDSIAFANVEKLRASMNQVCFSGSDVSIKLDLPQNTPKFPSLITIMPIWITRTNGDPNYVIYYESYPPGDAIGWEVYHQMQNRLITNLPDSFGDGKKTSVDVNNYVDSVRTLWNTQVVQKSELTLTSKTLEGIIINNIVLGGPRSDYYMGSAGSFSSGSGGRSGGGGGGASFDQSGTPVAGVGPENALADAFKYGKWEKTDEQTGTPSDGQNQFIFNDYRNLNSFEKTAIKYEACGENSLCLKTRSGVYRYPLEQCGGPNGIKSIQMVYDDRSNAVRFGTDAAIVVGGVISIKVWGFGGALLKFLGVSLSSGKSIIKFILTRPIVSTVIGTVAYNTVGEWLAGAFLSYKVQDFNIASPCSVKQMTIKKTSCNNYDPGWMPDYALCKKYTTYPIYEYGTDGKLKRAGEHYTCLDKVNDEISTPDGLSFKDDDQCLQVIIREKASGFCWTPDPWTPDEGILDISDTRGLAELIGFTPVYSNTAYVSSSTDARATILKSYPIIELESFGDLLQRRFTWAWPG